MGEEPGWGSKQAEVSVCMCILSAPGTDGCCRSADGKGNFCSRVLDFHLVSNLSLV